MLVRGLGLVLVMGVGLLRSETASANGRFPGATQLVIRGETVAITSSFGVVTSANKLTSTNWVCESSLGYDPVQNNELAAAVFPNKTTFLAGPAGLTASPDFGCSNPKANGIPAGTWMIDVSVDEKVVDGGPPSTGIAVSRGGADGQCAGELFDTRDQGATWSKLGKLPVGFCPLTVDTAHTDPLRVYVSGNILGPDGVHVQGQLLVSDDRGGSWVARDIPNQLLPFIGAMHPTEKDTLYIRTQNIPNSGDLLVTKDAGKTFTKLATLTGVPLNFFGVTGLALSPDGKKLAYGSMNEGLFVIDGDGPPTKRSDIPILCLTWTEDALWACSAPNRCGPWFVARSSDEGQSFTPVLPTLDIKGDQTACPGSTTTGAQCPAQWPGVRARLNPVCGDAGAPDSGPGDDAGPGDAGVEPPKPPPIGCGCSNTPVSFRGMALAIVAAIAAAAFTRRLRR